MIALRAPEAVALDLDGDLSHDSLAARLEEVRALLRRKQTLMSTNAGNPRSVLAFHVRVPLLPDNGFIETRAAYVACLERALAAKPAPPSADAVARDHAIMALLRVRRALDEELSRRLENAVQDGKVTPPMK